MSRLYSKEQELNIKNNVGALDYNYLKEVVEPKALREGITIQEALYELIKEREAVLE